MSNLEKLQEKLEDMKVKGLRITTVNMSSYSNMEQLASEMLDIINQFEEGKTTEWKDY